MLAALWKSVFPDFLVFFPASCPAVRILQATSVP
jgi:hypothetical protein